MFRQLLCFLSLLSVSLAAQIYPRQPAGYVTDAAGLLSAQQLQELNLKLHNFETSSSNQIFVYIASSLQGQDMANLCQEIFHTWKIGGAEKDNGVLLAIFVSDHKFRIHTGYGLEGALPDLLTRRIQDEDMRPLFKDGDYAAGINKGVDQLMYYSMHEYVPPPPKKRVSWMVYAFAVNGLLLIGLAVILIRRKQALDKATKRSLAGWGIFVSLMPVLGTLVLLALIGKAFGLDYKKLIGDLPTRDDPSSYADGGWTWFSGGSSSGSSSSGSSSSSDSSFDFGGGGGGDSGGGGSDSDW